MSRLYHTGFEWQSVTAGVEWATSNAPGAGAFEIDTTVHHSGSASCKFTTSNSASRYMEHLFRATAATTGVYIRFYIYVQQRPDVTVAIAQALNNATSEAAIALRSDGALELFDTDITGASLGTSGVLSLNTQYMVELFVDNGGSPNEVEARLGGSSFATGATSLAGDVDTIYVGAIDWHTSTAAIFNIDDISINDTAGSVNNSWPGEEEIVAALLTGAGDNAATTGIYSYINEVPPSNTATSGSTMIELDSNGVIADYNVTNSSTLGIGSSDTINAISVLARVREEAAGTSSYQLRIKSASGGTVTSTAAADGGNTTVRTNPASTTAFARPLYSETDPDTATAWTPTGTNSIDNMQIGVTNVDTDSTPDLWVTAMVAMIGYTPASGTLYTSTLNETVALTASILNTPGKVLSDTTTITASILKSTQRFLSDTVTHTDTVLKTGGKMLSETITHTDTILKQAGKMLSEVITHTESIIKSQARTLLETITHTETLVKQNSRTLSETVTHTDTFTSALIKVLELTETIINTDSILKTIGRNLSETITHTATLLKTPARQLTETVTHTATIVKAQSRTLSETVIHTDSVLKIPSRIFSEAVTFTDSIIKTGGKVFSETITHTDSIIKNASRNLLETINHTDTIIKSQLRTLSETVNTSDTFERFVTITRMLTEQLTLTDTIALLKSAGRTLSETITITDTLIIRIKWYHLQAVNWLLSTAASWYSAIATAWQNRPSSGWFTKNSDDWKE